MSGMELKGLEALLKDRTPGLMDSKRAYAVLVPLVEQNGELCLLYLGGYGLGRFIIEGIRTDTLFIPGTTLPVSQVLALLMVVFAVGADIVVRVRSRASRSKG